MNNKKIKIKKTKHLSRVGGGVAQPELCLASARPQDKKKKKI
jgi:hypothetical protein